MRSGVRILREEAAALGYKPSFSILDSTDCFGIVSELAGSVDKATIRKLQSLISNWKSALVSPDEARKNAQNESESSPRTLSQAIRQPCRHTRPSISMT
jgi:ATP-dependent DNA helicase Rep